MRTNPLTGQRNLPMFLLPQFSYYGERFFLDNLDVGYTLFADGHNEVSLLATPGYDEEYIRGKQLYDALLGENLDVTQALFSSVHGLQTKLRNSLQPWKFGFENDLQYLGGFEWEAGFGPVSTQLDVLRQAASAPGIEVRAALGMPIRLTHGTLNIHIGGTWKTPGYSYGLFSGSVSEPHSSFDPFITLRYSLPLTAHWRLGPYVQLEHVSETAFTSVDPGELRHDFVITAFAGAFYDF